MKDKNTEALIKETFDKYEICYAYNDFGFYYLRPMPKEDCTRFINKMNEYKGGHWEVRKKADYEHHYNLLYEKSSVCSPNTNAWIYDRMGVLEYQKCYLKS